MLPGTWLDPADNTNVDPSHHPLPIEHVATYHDGADGPILVEQEIGQLAFTLGDATAVTVGGLNAQQRAAMEIRLGVTGVFGVPMLDYTESPIGWASCGEPPATEWEPCDGEVSDI